VGPRPRGSDFLNSVYGALPWIVLLAFVFAYLVLARAFPITRAAPHCDTGWISCPSAWPTVVLVAGLSIRDRITDLGTYHVSQIEGWVPVFLFAMLFGLSMDYEVFIVSRMREAWRNGATNDDAIIEGLSNTGGVVTSAALIMVAALSGLVLGHIAGLTGTGHRAGVRRPRRRDTGARFVTAEHHDLARATYLVAAHSRAEGSTCPLPRPSRFRDGAVSRVGEAIT